MSENDALKRAASLRAAEWIRDGMVLGLGTGSTVYHLLEEIGAQRSRGAWKNVVGVPTSVRTAELAREFGIPLVTLAERPEIDLTIDGADEVDPDLNLIKGLGGALLREKVVATVSATVIIAIDESKLVHRLGTRGPLPVEVDPFGVGAHDTFFATLPATPRLRADAAGNPSLTDGGNYIIDCTFEGGIPDVEALALRLDARPGIIEHGLFLDLADHVVVGTPGGVDVHSRGDKYP